MQRSRWMEGLFPALLCAALVMAGCKEASETPEGAELKMGTLQGRLIPIVDSLSLAETAPIEFVEVVREGFSRVEVEETVQALAVAPRPWDPTPSAPPVPVPEDQDFVPGEAVVKLRGGIDEALARLEQEDSLGDYRFQIGDWATREIVSLRFRRERAPEIVPTQAETFEVTERLAASGIFQFAHPNRYRYALRAPNDEYYGRTWHYHQLDMESAWAITTGSPDVVIAVVDTGVKEHEDLTRLLPGYDFVSNAQIAGDGDGRDPDPSPTHGRRGSYHGQHVAGTIAADSDNEIGIPGMDWQAKILPVRTLGARGYGTSIDLIASITWAAGWEVPGVPPNPHPAHVINLSVGGGTLEAAEQEAIYMARARGAILVVAAGNDAIDARNQALAGYQGVISVGATDIFGRAPYSNYGPAITVMAPGGNLYVDRDGDEFPDGVYSLWFSQEGTVSSYRFQQGTSMAAPHVAGLIGLMKSLAPDLSHDDAERILRQTARPEYQCREGCGAGLIDPPRALEAVMAQAAGVPELLVPVERLELGPRNEFRLPITNGGTSPLAWYARFEGPDASRFRLVNMGGTINPRMSRDLLIRVDRDRLEDRHYQATLLITSTGGTVELPVSFSVGPMELSDLGIARVLAFRFGDEGELVVGGETEAEPSLGYAFELPVPPGRWYVSAAIDLDGDGVIGENDLLGFWPQNAEPLEIEVMEEATREGMEFILEPVGSRAKN